MLRLAVVLVVQTAVVHQGLGQPGAHTATKASFEKVEALHNLEEEETVGKEGKYPILLLPGFTGSSLENK